MDLNTYLTKTGRGAAAALAQQIGVHAVMVSQWSADKNPKRVAVERCTAIEQATDRAVMRWDLRPDDWHRIWPELIGQQGAPAVPEPAKA